MRILTGVLVLSAVALVQVPCHCTIEAFDVGTRCENHLRPGKLYRLDANTLVVTSWVGQKAVYAFGTDHGSKWRIVEMPLPAGCDADGVRCGLALSPQFFLLGGRAPTGGVNPSGMPVWYGGPTGNWKQTTLLNGPVTGRTTWMRFMALGAPPPGQSHPPRIWATGYEWQETDNKVKWRLWYSDDSGVTWSNRNEPALAWSDMANLNDLAILDTSPGKIVWGKAGHYYLFHLDPNSLSSFVPSPRECWKMRTMSAPTDDVVYMFYERRMHIASTDAAYMLGRSNDRGRTWNQVSLHGLDTSTMDFADADFGILAFNTMFAHPSVPAQWKLWITSDGGKSGTLEPLGSKYDGYDMWDIEVVSRQEAFLLMIKWVNSGWYSVECLRWRPTQSSTGGPVMIETDRTGGTATVAVPIAGSILGIPKGPYLRWWNQGKFVNCGVYPTSGVVTDKRGYQFRVVYSCADNKPPTSVEMRHHESGNRWSMSPVDPNAKDYRAGVLYECFVRTTAFLPDDTCRYRFIASDGKEKATGVPTQSDPNMLFRTPPLPVGSAVLSWCGVNGWKDGGVYPVSGPPDTVFDFRVLYTHPAGTPPKSIQLKIESFSKKWDLAEIKLPGRNCKNGALFGMSSPKNLFKPGTYRYRFTANDGVENATGVATQWDPKYSVVVSTPPSPGGGPVLSWRGVTGWQDGGVYPVSGPPDTVFDFRVLYTHPAGTPPKSIQLKIESFSKKWDLAEIKLPGRNCKNGALFGMSSPKNLFKPGTYRYRFTANDGVQNATGVATQWNPKYSFVVTK